MKKIEPRGERECIVCGYIGKASKFLVYDEVEICPVCGSWKDNTVPTNAELCCECGEEFAEIGENVCKWCRQRREEKWEDDYYETIGEELTREAIIAEDDTKRLDRQWYCWDCGYSGDEKEFPMIDEHNVQCPQCQGINTSPATSPWLTICENCGTVIPVETADKNRGLCELCIESEKEYEAYEATIERDEGIWDIL